MYAHQMLTITGRRAIPRHTVQASVYGVAQGMYINMDHAIPHP